MRLDLMALKVVDNSAIVGLIDQNVVLNGANVGNRLVQGRSVEALPIDDHGKRGSSVRLGQYDIRSRLPQDGKLAGLGIGSQKFGAGPKAAAPASKPPCEPKMPLV
jgi:hypothetical protein